MALPQIPPRPQPFTVAEYLPTPGVTPYHDTRQHAVSLAYVVPVAGRLPTPAGRPRPGLDDARRRRAASRSSVEMTGGHGYLLRQAMAHVGRMA